MLTTANAVIDHLQIDTDVYDDVTTVQCFPDSLDEAATITESRLLLEKTIGYSQQVLNALQSTMALIDAKR